MWQQLSAVVQRAAQTESSRYVTVHSVMIRTVEIMFQQQKADINGCLTSHAVLAQPVMLDSPGWTFLAFHSPSSKTLRHCLTLGWVLEGLFFTVIQSSDYDILSELPTVTFLRRRPLKRMGELSHSSSYS